MEKFTVDNSTIKPYFQGHKKHKNYWKALDEYFHMDFHFNGYFIPPVSDYLTQVQKPLNTKPGDIPNPYFDRLITQRRPSESEQINAYRKTIYLPESKSPCFKVYNSLRKIVDSNDWKVDYTDYKAAAGIAENETLEIYCEKEYPEFTSIKNWFSTYALKAMLVDSNALVYVLPKEYDIPENEYYKPIATIINCQNVYEFKENEYAIFDCDRDYEYMSGKVPVQGKCIGIITKYGYYEARQLNNKQDFEIIDVMTYELEYLPAFLTGGVVKKYTPDYTLYNSFLSPMLPGLDGMAMAISDEDAEWVQHVFSTMWYFSAQDCSHCQGTGRVKKGKGEIVCTVCKGQGNAPKSPYRDLVIKPSTASDITTTPTPPAGYIQKQTEIVNAFIARVNKKEYRALSSINHEFLAEIPLDQSGIAKQYDRQELEIFVGSVAQHSVVNIIENVYYFINEFRYMERVKSETDRVKMLPKINVPKQYDLVTSTILEAQMKSAMDAKADPDIIDEIELEYAAKNFPNNKEMLTKLKLKKKLDPLPRTSVSDKSEMILNGSAEMIDIVTSNYLQSFIEQALFEHENFDILPLDKQKEIIKSYAEEKMTNLDAAQKIKQKAALEKAKAGADPNLKN